MEEQGGRQIIKTRWDTGTGSNMRKSKSSREQATTKSSGELKSVRLERLSEF